MKRNMGNADRVIRLLIALAVAILYYTNILTGTLAIILLVIAGIFVLTSLVSICPLYSLFGIHTCPMQKQKQV